MILVTGATGHIGNVLVRQLIKRGQKVRALILPGEERTPLDGLDVEPIEGDVLDTASLEAAFQGVDTVYHLAGVISIMPGKNSLLERVNVDGTLNLLRIARLAHLRRLVYTSSIHAISRAPSGVCIDESLPYDPDNPYGAYDRSKALASLAVQQAALQGMDAVIACPTGVIGPYDFRRSEMGQLIFDCACQKPQFYVDGAYDFVDVRDVARGLIQTCEKGLSGESYILAGERISIQHLLESVWKVTGKRFFSHKIPLRLAQWASLLAPYYYRLTYARPRFTPYSLEVITSNANISHAKATRELGYQPRPITQTIADTVHWFLENRRLLAGAGAR